MDEFWFLFIGFTIVGIGLILSMMMILSRGFLVDLITIKKYNPPFDYSKLGANRNE